MHRLMGLAVGLVLIFSRAAVASPAVAQRGSEGTGMFDLPIGKLLLAWGIAALIGAAGGAVYAGIMGPKRDAQGSDAQNT
jgi:hypothetical protein